MSPLQGSDGMHGPHPGLTPWALTSRPFRANYPFDSSVPGRSPGIEVDLQGKPCKGGTLLSQSSSSHACPVTAQLPQLPDGLAADGILKFGSDFFQWHQDEVSLVEGRVGNDQFGAPDLLLTIKKNVHVDHSRPLPLSANSAQFLFRAQTDLPGDSRD